MLKMVVAYTFEKIIGKKSVKSAVKKSNLPK